MKKSMAPLNQGPTEPLEHRCRSGRAGPGGRNGLLADPALTVPLALLTACVSMWSNNWHMYGWKYLGAALAFVAVLALFIFLVAHFLYKRHRRGPASRSADLGAGFIICLLAVGAGFVLLNAPITRIAFKTGLADGWLAAGAVAGVSLLVYFAGFRTLNFFLAMWLGLAAVDGVYRAATFDGGYERAVDLRVELKTRPNIYLFYLESYHGLSVLEEVFGMDPGPMRTFLTERGFFIHEPVMSNSPHTLGSMADTFTFQLSPIQPSGLVDEVMPDVRNAVGGSPDNTLFRILKENGYHTTFFAGTKPVQYFFNLQGPYLDDTDANMMSLWVKPFYNLNEKAFEFLTYLTTANSQSIYWGSLADRLKTALELGRERGGPIFVSFKGGADHTPNENYAGTPEEFEKWKPKYRSLVARGDAELERAVEYLVKADPDSVIILIGDHGAQGYKELFAKPLLAGDVDGFKRIMAEYGLTQQQVTDSFFNVLLAIRLPGGQPTDISQGLPMSHVNLFRHVFAYLNDDPGLLKDRAPTRSANIRLILARDNQPVCERLEAK